MKSSTDNEMISVFTEIMFIENNDKYKSHRSMENHQYCLKWGNHTNTITDIMYKFFEHKFLVDVTLACIEHGQIQYFGAHQMVLSANSPYFESLFSRNTHPHPIIFLKDIKGQEMMDILTFMYKGEVDVHQCKIRDILETAKSLMIRGLSEEYAYTSKSTSKTESRTKEVTNDNPADVFSKKQKYIEPDKPLSLKVNSSMNVDHHNDFIDLSYSGTQLLNDPRVFSVTGNSVFDNTFQANAQQSNATKCKDRLLASKINMDLIYQPDPVLSGSYRCFICTKSVKSRWHHSQTHFSRHHECPKCKTIYSRIDTLKLHIKKIHGVDMNKL